MTTTTTPNFYDVMAERGLVAQCTDTPEAFRRRMESPTVAYSGFDPTADSLHVGNLVPIMGLARLQRCGHRPIVLVGGATGLVGDPGGKTESRKLMTEEHVRQNVAAVTKQFARFLDFGDPEDPKPTDAVIVNNLDWIGPLSWLEVLRDVGSKMSVNRMVSMEYIASRLSGDGEGISYLEFSYMLLQAYDFVHLHRERGCALQIAGQDQWGNIVMGIELGRKMADADLAGLTFPLVTKSDGKKFGKSESGNVWLDAGRTSPFEFYQFWRNVGDAEVGRYLATFTFLPMDEVDALASAEGTAINESKVRLAYEVTKLVHGEEEAGRARDSANKAFSTSGAAGGGDVTGDAIPSAALSADELAAGPGVLDLLIAAKLAKSKGEARRLIQGGGVRVHDEKIGDIAHTLGPDDAPGGYVLLRAGKKRLFRFDVQ